MEEKKEILSDGELNPGLPRDRGILAWFGIFWNLTKFELIETTFIFFIS